VGDKIIQLDMLSLSLVLPTVDRPEALYNLMRHLEHQERPPDEIVVVDQSVREDARVAAYAAAHPRVRYHRIERRGLPNARNVGLRLAIGDIVLFLDDDIIPDPGLCEAHLANYADPGVAGVGGRVMGGYDAAAGGVGEFHALGGTVVRNFGTSVRREVDHIPGGNMSFRREVFARVGGFDTAFGGAAIGEETDFCLRARRAGFRLVFDPRAAMEHLRLPSGGCREDRFEDWLYWHAHNGMLFALRWARMAFWPLFVLGRTARFALFALEHGSIELIPVGLRGLVRGVATHQSGRG
jgi:GT2 family glycosyltransferase